MRIGWLTPMLGLLVMLDLTSFWGSAWGVREALPVKSLTLLLLLLFTAAYYLAATLVFPESPDEQPDFDAHYWANERMVLAAVFLLNLPSYLADWLLNRVYLHDAFGIVVASTFLVLVAATWWAPGRRANLVLLAMTITLYPIGAIGGVLR